MVDPVTFPRDSQKPLVLIVDDSTETLRLLTEWLRSDYRIVAARDGPAAIQLAAQLRPDLVLLDVVLPGLNGFQVADELRHDPRLARILIIFMSGLQHPQNARQSLELGGLDYLVKPLDEHVVRALVRAALDGRRA